MRRNLVISALLVFLAGPAGAYLDIWSPMIGFGMFVLSGLVGVIALVWNTVSWLRYRQRSYLISALLAAIPVVALIVPMIGASGYPPINDITSDLDDPPRLSVAPELPASFKPIIADAYPNLTSLSLTGDPQQIFAKALDLAKQQRRWSVTRVADAELVFEGVARTALFQFQDDFVVRVRSADHGRAVVDMRSRSRDGKGDLGANANRIRAFFTELQAQVHGG